jgi:hypothetical protein
MLKKKLIATAAAGMIAVGSLVATTVGASASSGFSGSFSFGGPGWSLQFGNPGYGRHHNRHCRPIVKTVKFWKWGRPHWRQVVVGYDCHRRGGHGRGHGKWGGGWDNSW